MENNESDQIHTYNIYPAKDTKKIRRQTKDSEKIFAIYKVDKGLIPIFHKELLQTIQEKEKHSIMESVVFIPISISLHYVVAICGLHGTESSPIQVETNHCNLIHCAQIAGSGNQGLKQPCMVLPLPLIDSGTLQSVCCSSLQLGILEHKSFPLKLGRATAVYNQEKSQPKDSADPKKVRAQNFRKINQSPD